MLQNILSNPTYLLATAFALFMAISNALVFVGKVTNSPRLESFARKAGGFIVVAEKVAEDVAAAPTKIAAAAVFIQDVEKALDSGDLETIRGAFLRHKISLVNLVPGLMTKLDTAKDGAK